MKPKNIRIRMDKDTGALWLVEEAPFKPIRRLRECTGDVLLALSAEIVAVDGTKQAIREVQFSDGAMIRLTIEDLSMTDMGLPAQA